MILLASPTHTSCRTRALRVVLLCACLTGRVAYSADASNEIHRTTSQLAELRGFRATDHYVITSDGYILNLVRAYNPMLDPSELANKPPVLFIHGFFNNGNVWLVNSRGAKPQNYAAICSNATQEQLLKLAQSDPGFNSVPITFMNCGREVWILNRRGTMQSLGHTGADLEPYGDFLTDVDQTLFGGLPSLVGLLSLLGGNPSTFRGSKLPEDIELVDLPNVSINPRYWNFSLDEQARYDVSAAVDYVLEQTNKTKLDVVAHSAGGQIFLMAQVLQPDLSAKVNKALLYAPAIYLNQSRGQLFTPLLPALESYIGPVPPETLLVVLRTLIDTVCASPVSYYTICSPILQFIMGFDGFTEVLKLGYADSIDMVSSHEAAHLTQTTNKKKTHFYDFQDPDRNQIAYNQSRPPIYNISRIRPQKMAIWYGDTDAEVPTDNIPDLESDLQFDVELHYLHGPGIDWNHMSYFYRLRGIPEKLTVPSLMFLESLDSEDVQ